MLYIITACKSNFDPLQSNDRYAFTMYGTLDLHADTQWVRVMPIGEKLIPDNPESTEVEVMLTRLSTGESVVMNDSLFRFGGDAYVWNYWVPLSLYSNEQYKVTAEGPDGEQSTSIITTPSLLSVPEIDYSVGIEGGTIKGSNDDSLVVLEIEYIVQVLGCTPEREVRISLLDKVEEKSGGQFSFEIDNRIPLVETIGTSSFGINSRKLIIVTGSKDWPDLSVLTDEEITLPDVATNVEHGTGLIAGIARREVQLTPRRPPC